MACHREWSCSSHFHCHTAELDGPGLSTNHPCIQHNIFHMFPIYHFDLRDTYWWESIYKIQNQPWVIQRLRNMGPDFWFPVASDTSQSLLRINGLLQEPGWGRESACSALASHHLASPPLALQSTHVDGHKKNSVRHKLVSLTLKKKSKLTEEVRGDAWPPGSTSAVGLSAALSDSLLLFPRQHRTSPPLGLALPVSLPERFKECLRGKVGFPCLWVILHLAPASPRLLFSIHPAPSLPSFTALHPAADTSHHSVMVWLLSLLLVSCP